MGIQGVKIESIGSDPKSLAGRPDDPAEMLGQVFTPEEVADKMVEILLPRHRSGHISVLDPAVGPATFPRALHRSGLLRTSDHLHVYDIDPAMITTTRSFLQITPWKATIKQEDYLESQGGLYDFAIMNPPYVRQEWLINKAKYQRLFANRYGVRVPGTSNLYVYFMVKVIAELKTQGKLVCIVYDSWIYTKFGEWLAGLISANCDEFEVVPLGVQPFSDRLIDATIVVARRSSSAWVSEPIKVGISDSRHVTPFSEMLNFKTVDELFATKRGLRLKQAAFFLVDLKDSARLSATPFVKKPAKIKGYTVHEDHNEAALLIYQGSELMNNTLAELRSRLDIAQTLPAKNVTILTWYSERPDTWYMHRRPPYAQFLFNYYLRSRPRHIYNPTRPYADNFYGLTPKKDTDPLVLLSLLNSTAVCAEMLFRARNQGSGLAKIQLYEYRYARVPDWSCLSKHGALRLQHLGQQLIDSSGYANKVLAEVDEVIANEFGGGELRPDRVNELLDLAFERVRNGGKH